MDPSSFDGFVTDRQTLKLLAVMNVLREWEREMPAQLIATFLYVASHNDCPKSDLVKPIEEGGLGFTEASASRNTDCLAKIHRLRDEDGKRRQGLGLIKKYSDPERDGRLKFLKLTPQGEALNCQLKQILYG